MKYLQFEPPDYLKSHVRYFWTLEYTDEDVVPCPFLPLADGCPGLIFQVANEQCLNEGMKNQLPTSFLYGQTIKFPQLYLTGRFKLLGVFFLPNAISSIFKLSAHELTDSFLNLDSLAPWRELYLTEQLLSTVSTQQQIGLISAFLFNQLENNSFQVEQTTQFALNELITSKGTVSLRALQKQMQLSERSFQRKFEQYVGISPKMFSRVCRFQASLSQLRSNNYSKLSDIAFDNGYADQPHFIRSFKEFTGDTPCEFQRKSMEVVRICSLY